MEHAWARIRGWLELNAPVAAIAALPGASADDIDAVAREVGTPLPADLIDWWRQMGGLRPVMGETDLLPPLYRPISIDEALSGRRISLAIDEDIERLSPDRPVNPRDAGTEASRYPPTFLPIAQTGTGDSLVVDLRGGPRHGCVMEWSPESGCSWTPLWASTAVMLSDVADALENDGEALSEHVRETRLAGHPALPYVAAVTAEGGIAWEPVDPEALLSSALEGITSDCEHSPRLPDAQLQLPRIGGGPLPRRDQPGP